MISKIGKCTEAYNIKNRGVILGVDLYTRTNIPHGELVLTKILSNGAEQLELQCQFNCVFSGKRQYPELNLYSLLTPTGFEKNQFLGNELILICDYEFDHIILHQRQ